MGRGRRSKKPRTGSLEPDAPDLEWCETCQCGVPRNPKSLAEHFDCEGQHKRKERLHLMASYFARNGLDYFPAGTAYYCQICHMQLPNHVDKLLYHLEKYAAKHGVQVRVEPIPFPATGNEVLVRRSITLVDFASTNDDLNAQLVGLERVSSPITMVESGPSPIPIFDLRCDVFTPDELDVVTRVVLHLERRGRNVARSEVRGSTRLCMWGMRSVYGDTGWYVQDNHSCYGLAEDLARYVCAILRRSYLQIFDHLDSIPTAEGFHGDEARIGGGPFSTFAISRDFNSRPHRDEDDYGYGFVFWLLEGRVPAGVEPSLLPFPEAGVSFVPRHGDVLCFRPGQYLHCTRRLAATDLLGVAFLQKCSLYRQLRELTLPEGSGSVTYRSRDSKTNIVETRAGFLAKKETYQRRVRESPLTVSDFMSIS